MNIPLEQLGQYGAAGIVLAAVLGSFLWAFKRLFDHVLLQQVDFKSFMDQSVKAMNGIQMTITDGNKEIVESIRGIAESKTQQVIDTIQRESRDR